MMINQWWRWVEGVFLGSQGCQVYQSAKRELQAGVFLFIEHQYSNSRWVDSGWPDIAQRPVAPGRPRALVWISRVDPQRPLDSQRHSQPVTGRDPQDDRTRVHKASDRVHKLHKEVCSWPDAYGQRWPDAPGVRSSPSPSLRAGVSIRQVATVGLDLRVRSCHCTCVRSRQQVTGLVDVSVRSLHYVLCLFVLRGYNWSDLTRASGQAKDSVRSHRTAPPQLQTPPPLVKCANHQVYHPMHVC
jgi:hypothetical protein